jgi:hypothetical protein
VAAQTAQQQAATGRPATQGDWEPAHHPPSADEQIRRAEALLKRLSAVAADLAAIQEAAARLHDELAASDRGHANAHRRNASQAREVARKLGAISRELPADPAHEEFSYFPAPSGQSRQEVAMTSPPRPPRAISASAVRSSGGDSSCPAARRIRSRLCGRRRGGSGEVPVMLAARA